MECVLVKVKIELIGVLVEEELSNIVLKKIDMKICDIVVVIG